MKTQIAITNSTTLNDLPDVLTVATLAAYLHTTRQNICKMLIAGEIRSVKVKQFLPFGVGHHLIGTDIFSLYLLLAVISFYQAFQ